MANEQTAPAVVRSVSASPLRNAGQRCPADRPTVEEIVAVMRRAGDGRHRRRMRGLIVALRPAWLRIHEAVGL